MSSPASPPTTSLAKRLLVVAVILASGAFVVLLVVLSVMHEQRDPVEDMRRANEVALELAALDPALRAASNVPEVCPEKLRPHRAADPEARHPPPVVDAEELLRFAPPDAVRSRGGPAPGSKPGSKAEWRFSYKELADLRPWEDPSLDRVAELSASAAEMFERGYVIVIETLSIEEPRVQRSLVGDDTFVSGHVRGRATLFDLEGAHPLCRTTFEAESSGDVEWRQGDSYAERAVHEDLERRVVIVAAAAIERIAPALRTAE